MSLHYRRVSTLLAATALIVSLSACAFGTVDNAANQSPSGSSTTSEPSGEITVFAAASLKTPFTTLAEKFEATHPGTTIKLSFAGSADLVTQLTAGAPADVFASADTKNMSKLQDADLVADTPVDFATNTLEIAVPPANPAAVNSLGDLVEPGLKLVICAPQVPCGAATKAVEETAGIKLAPVSEESSVTDVLGKVTSGEADAGLVYLTDIKSSGDKVRGIKFPESSAAVNIYPITTVSTSKNKALADAFITSITDAAGQKVLTDAGFGTP